MSTIATDTQRPLGEPLWFLHNLSRILVDGEHSNGRFALVEMTGGPGDMPPLHVHHHEDETFYVLDASRHDQSLAVVRETGVARPQDRESTAVGAHLPPFPAITPDALRPTEVAATQPIRPTSTRSWRSCARRVTTVTDAGCAR